MDNSKAQIIGYIRVSTLEQNVDRQLEGVKIDKKYIDKVSGKDTNRPQLKALLDYVRDGDIIITHSMDRLARNLDDLRRLVTTLTNRGISIQFVKESLTFTNKSDSMSNLLLSVMGAFAEFERSLIHERQLEGIELAKARGAYKGGKLTLNDTQIKDIKTRAAQGENKTKIAKLYNIDRRTVYRYINRECQQPLDPAVNV